MKKGWEIKTLGEVCEVVGGGTPKTGISEYWAGEVVWVTPKDLGQLKTVEIFDTAKRISKKGLEKSSAKLLPVGSVVMSSRAPIGYVAIAGTELATNQGCRNFICGNKIFNKYLYYFLFANTELLNQLGSGATFKEISGTTLKGIDIPLPTISEQKWIVEFLDDKFGAVEELKKVTEQQIADAKKLFESRLNEVFEKILTTNNLVMMSDIYDVRDGTHDSPKYQNDGYPLVTSKNLKDGELLMENIKYISEKDYLDICRRSEVSKGDVLLAMIGTIGNPVVIKDEPNFAIKNVALFKVPVNQDSDFLRYYLMTKLVVDKMKKDAKGATQKFVGLGYLRSFLVPDISFFEQKKIIKELDELSEKTKKLEAIFRRKIADLEELKKSYLEQAFSGNL